MISSKCSLKHMSFACKASCGGQRRNSDFSKQNRSAYSRNRNRSNEDKDSSDNLDESEFLSTKIGPLLSLFNSPKSQATTSPGPREREIVELFRKVQAQLRQRTAVKEEKKSEALKGQNKESETVDSLLKLLRKHSVEQGKRKVNGGGDNDFIFIIQDRVDNPSRTRAEAFSIRIVLPGKSLKKPRNLHLAGHHQVSGASLQFLGLNTSQLSPIQIWMQRQMRLLLNPTRFLIPTLIWSRIWIWCRG